MQTTNSIPQKQTRPYHRKAQSGLIPDGHAGKAVSHLQELIADLKSKRDDLDIQIKDVENVIRMLSNAGL